jgi:predicted HTH transcriptional regulator
MEYTRDEDEQRLLQAIDFGIETRTIEFKSALHFDILKYKITKCAQGMSNNRDGGVIVVGINEPTQGQFEFVGLTDELLADFGRDRLYTFINSFASPAIEHRRLEVVVDSRTFLGLIVPPLGRTPTICKNDTPQTVTDSRDVTRRGDIFIRPAHSISTERVSSAADLEPILNACANIRAAEIVRILTESGHIAHEEPLEEEVSDLADFL